MKFEGWKSRTLKSFWQIWYEGVKQIWQNFQGSFIIVLASISCFSNSMLTKKSSNINECPCLVDMNKRITYWTLKWEMIIRLTWNCVRWSILIVYIRFRHLFLKLMLRSLFIHEKGHLSKSLIASANKGLKW